MKTFKWFVCCTLFLACTSGLTGSAMANGAPIKIFLNYLPEFSNYGPTDARGEALISIGEAWVELNIEGLPELEGELYEAWLISADDEEMISVGTFNTDAEGKVSYFVELGEIPDIDYRFFIITVEPEPDPSSEPNPRRTIAGVFPDPKLQIVTETPAATPEPGVTVTPGPPATPGPPVSLPVTGNMASSTWTITLGLLMLGLGIISFIFIKIRSDAH